MSFYSRPWAARRRLSRHLYSPLLVFVLIQMTPSNAPGAQGEVRFQFEISPGPAQKSLLEFGVQSRLNVGFSADEVEGVYTNAVNEFLESRGALARLLDRTSLCSDFSASGKSVSIRPCSKPRGKASLSSRPGEGDSSGPVPALIPSIETVSVIGQNATGTNIHGVQPPVSVISRQDIELYGIRSTAELFERFPELAGATPAGARALGNSGLGIAGNVRGQGASLILLNGQRLPSSGDQGAFQDISLLPLSAIDRVEITPDGESAKYGSDAVGGVINVMTLSGSQQAVFSAQHDHGMGSPFEQTTSSQVVGGSWGSGAGVVTLDYLHSTPWKGPNLVTPQTGPIVDRVPAEERGSAYGHLQQDLTGRTELIAEGIYTHRRDVEQYDTVLEANAPEAVVSQRTGVSVQMTWLDLQLRAVLTGNSVLELSASRGTETERQRIWAAGPVVLADGTTGSAPASIVSPTWFSMFSRTDEVALHYDWLLTSYAAGDLKGAVGAEYRRQTLNTLDSSSSPQFPTRYSRRVSAAFAELHVPIAGEGWAPSGLRQLEFAVSGRYEKNSDFKYRFTPQTWVRWVPWQRLELRASWGRSYRAPLLPNLDTSRNAIVLSSVVDSQSPTGQSEALVISGNSPTLTGETATTESFGARLDWPLSGRGFLNTELRYFRIHFYDRIQSPDLSQIDLADSRYAPLIDSSLALRPRLCSSPQFYGDRNACLADPIAAIVNVSLKNIDSLSTQGMEFRSDWGTDLAAARLEVDVRGAWFFQFAERITPTAAAVTLLRSQNSPAALQLSSLFSLQLGHVQFRALVNFLSGFRDDSTQPPLDIRPWTTVDLGAQYSLPAHSGGVLENSTLLISVRNIADQQMPLLSDPAANQNYDLLSGLAARRIVSFGVQKRL